MQLVPQVFKTLSYTLFCSNLLLGAFCLDLETKKNKEIYKLQQDLKHYINFLSVNHVARQEYEEFQLKK